MPELDHHTPNKKKQTFVDLSFSVILWRPCSGYKDSQISYQVGFIKIEIEIEKILVHSVFKPCIFGSHPCLLEELALLPIN